MKLTHITAIAMAAAAFTACSSSNTPAPVPTAPAAPQGTPAGIISPKKAIKKAPKNAAGKATQETIRNSTTVKTVETIVS